MTAGPLVQWLDVPAGIFTMGSDLQQDKRAYGNELPQHDLWLDSFEIAKHLVTNTDYAAFVLATGHRLPKFWMDGSFPSHKARHPVVGVDWHDARAYCAWLNARLPTEAEWEKAARGVDRRLYPWGNQRPTAKRCNQCHFFGDTTEVDRFELGASAYGAFDMGGNVWEWTASKAAPYPYDATDGRERVDDERVFRVLRGGGFRTVNLVRCAFRDVGTYPEDADVFRGFRPARASCNNR